MPAGITTCSTTTAVLTVLSVCYVCFSAILDERSRFRVYRQLLWQLPDDNRATLSALFGHFYM